MGKGSRLSNMALTIKEVADRLNVPIETVYRWIRQGKIPMQHSRGEYAIRPEMLARWADEHKLKMHSPGPAIEPDPEPEVDGILQAMQRGGIFYDLAGEDKEQVLRSAVERIPNIQSSDGDLIYEKLVEREQMASTGIGHGIAIPHPRTKPDIQLALPQITTCFLARPVPFEAIDNQPVSVLMVLLSNSTKQHLSLLSKLSFYLRDTNFRTLFLTKPSPPAILDKIAELESNSD